MQFTSSSEACPHSWDESIMRTAHSTVHRDECAYCCNTCQMTGGVFVCMGCFAGFCAAHIAKHLAQKPSHVMFTRIEEIPEEHPEPEVKDVNYLGVVRDKQYNTCVCCAACQASFTSVPELAVDSYTSIIHAPMPGAQAAAQEGGGYLVRPQCPHLVCLEQLQSPYSANDPPTSAHMCSAEGCGCTMNNWMCVTCGAIGCPRAESGGNGHALQHYTATGHPCCVKVGTVTPEGADFYCYSCDDEVSDLHFAAHMAHFGIDVATAQKTAKTLGEMAYDYSSQFDFNILTESGSNLQPCYGPGHTGIINIGNSCYVASVVQCLLSLPQFHMTLPCVHQQSCTTDPYGCRYCQMERLADGLWSGRYSVQGAEKASLGVSIRSFKNVFAQDHPDFSTGQQQDAQEYLLYLLEQMQRFIPSPTSAAHPVTAFDFVVEHRVECTKCHKVRYTKEKDRCLSLDIPLDPSSLPPVDVTVKPSETEVEARRPKFSLGDCLEAFVRPVGIDCRCGSCGAPSTYQKTQRIGTFPDVFAVYVRRAYFDVSALTTKKLDAYVDVPETINLEAYRSRGTHPGEVLMADHSPEPTARHPTTQEVDETALAMVVSMGIEVDIARYALLLTDMNVERAIDYIFSHPDIATEAAVASSAAPPPTSTTKVVDDATRDGPADYKLHAMISHMGSGAKSGHYICHIKDAEGQWVLFNDEKVGKSQSPPFSMASVYFFVRNHPAH